MTRRTRVGATANAFVKSPLTSKLIFPSTGLYYNVFLQVGSWATTQHTLIRTGSIANVYPGKAASYTGGTAQTVISAVGTDLTLATGGSPLRYWTCGY
jgi:hypothetical protein